VSRVLCIDCATTVIVDPVGRCPDGHLVGAAGARIETALGSDIQHPDEPVPWVAQVVLDAEPTSEIEAPRPIRPVTVPGVDLGDADGPADSEELLRELHSLSELSAELGSLDDLAGVVTARRGAARPAVAPPARPAPGHRRDPSDGAPTATGAAPLDRGPASPAPTPAADPTAVEPMDGPTAREPEARPRLAAVPDEPSTTTATRDEALSELTALEAAVQALDDREPEPAPEQLGAITDLFAAVQEQERTPPTTPAPEVPAPAANGRPEPSTVGSDHTAPHPATASVPATPAPAARAATVPSPAVPAPAVPAPTVPTPAVPARVVPAPAASPPPAPRAAATFPTAAATPAPAGGHAEPMSFTARTGGRRAAAAAKGKRRRFGR
jgi:hypothetical protein